MTVYNFSMNNLVHIALNLIGAVVLLAVTASCIFGFMAIFEECLA